MPESRYFWCDFVVRSTFQAFRQGVIKNFEASSASVCLYRLWRGSFGAILFLLLSGSLLGWWAVDAAQLGKLKPWAHSTAVERGQEQDGARIRACAWRAHA